MASYRATTRRPPSRWAAVSVLLMGALAGVALATFLALAVGPHLFAYRTLTMLSGSMRPVAAPGDVLVMRPEPTAAVRAGQVLAFAAPLPGAPVISHRVVSVVHGDDGTVIRTRGDANVGEDPWRLRLTGDTAWHLVGVVPGVGRAVSLLHRPLIWLITVWLLPLWICLETLRPRRPTPPRPPALPAHQRRAGRPSVGGSTARHRALKRSGRRYPSAARTRLLLTVPCTIALTLLPASPAAIASFTKTPAAPSATYATATLQPPTSPGGSCLRGGGPTATGTVTWTASASTFTTGYTVSWTGGSTGSTTTTSSPLTVPGLTKNSDYVFTVTATYNNWTSTSQATPTISC
jgi:signal peptidase I